MYWNGPGSELPENIKYGESCSMEGQDQWVLNLLSGKRYGTYVEVGGGHPTPTFLKINLAGLVCLLR